MLFIVPTINNVDLVRIRDRVLTAPCFAGDNYGNFPWDKWEAVAKEVGLDEDLRHIGRALFREAFQHDWSDELKVESGWLDGGQRMIYQAFAFPDACVQRWQHLLDTDGQPDDTEVPPVTTDPMELAEGLEAAGIKTGLVR